MLKSKKIWLVVILFIVTHIISACTCVYVCNKIFAVQFFSIYSKLNFKHCEDAKVLLKAIAQEIKKNPKAALEKIEKLQHQIPNSYEGFRTKEALEKAGFGQL